MGWHSYDEDARSVRSVNLGYTDVTKATSQIFKQRELHPLMDPKKFTVRECRDSELYPVTIPIIIALDETGSMGHVPRNFIAEGLPTIMTTLKEAGISGAQVCFVGVGDHKNDMGPLQVGQFEAGDEQLDKWLSSIWLEGKGGGNGSESYHLVYFFAAHMTSTDAFEKRNQKGFLFTIGDEACHPDLSKEAIEQHIGYPVERGYSFDELYALAKARYNVYHLHIGDDFITERSWKDRLGENLIKVSNYKDIPKLIVQVLLANKVEVISTSQSQSNIDDNVVNSEKLNLY